MALKEVNTTPFPLPLSAVKRLISRVCRSTWNNTLGDALRIASMGQYRSDFPQVVDKEKCPHFHSYRVVLRFQFLALNVATCDLPTLLAAAGVHPSRQHAVLRLTCAFLRKTVSALPLPPCVLRSQLLTLNVATLDLPTLLAAAGVHPSRQHAVIRLTCAFLRKTGGDSDDELCPSAAADDDDIVVEEQKSPAVDCQVVDELPVSGGLHRDMLGARRTAQQAEWLTGWLADGLAD
ncbi:hypothetical protein GWK47_002997 [Chionoecetes opilio]|uniref:Uncharacterized protein n=1 Tax=Chionoecetes opilio TaxID=41210 RepID=A0A8J8WAH0_CHIOP|nr:hypothetical protein GWK47_002997 [Chionoecetes opilio]